VLSRCVGCIGFVVVALLVRLDKWCWSLVVVCNLVRSRLICVKEVLRYRFSSEVKAKYIM